MVFTTSENITYNLPSDQAFFFIAHQKEGIIDNAYLWNKSLGVYRLDEQKPSGKNYFTNLPSVAVEILK